MVICGNSLSLDRALITKVGGYSECPRSRTKTLTLVGHVFYAPLFITELSASGSFFTMPRRSKRSKSASERIKKQLETAAPKSTPIIENRGIIAQEDVVVLLCLTITSVIGNLPS